MEEAIHKLLEERKTMKPVRCVSTLDETTATEGEEESIEELEEKLRSLDNRIGCLTKQREKAEDKLLTLVNGIKSLRKEYKERLESLAEYFSSENDEIDPLWKELSLFMNITKLNILSMDNNIVQCYINNKYKDKMTYLEVNLNEADHYLRAITYWESMLNLFSN
jgi:uncharacterized coiled-coil DUF342 family protein